MSCHMLVVEPSCEELLGGAKTVMDVCTQGTGFDPSMIVGAHCQGTEIVASQRHFPARDLVELRESQGKQMKQAEAEELRPVQACCRQLFPE
jgi:hypothetical protein